MPKKKREHLIFKGRLLSAPNAKMTRQEAIALIVDLMAEYVLKKGQFSDYAVNQKLADRKMMEKKADERKKKKKTVKNEYNTK